MNDIWFVTPAFRRYELSDICFAERAWAIEELKKSGVDAHCVVVANDDNIDLAKKYGFETVSRNNRWLGRRFNDGHEYAAQHGATHVVPVGSDSWVDPILYKNLPADDELLLSHYYSLVHGSGTKRAELWIHSFIGVSFIIPTALLKTVKNRPCGDYMSRGCDTSTYNNLVSTQSVTLTYQRFHRMEITAFHSPPPIPQVSSYEGLVAKYLLKETEHPFEPLKKVYPADLVDAVAKYYERIQNGHS